MAIGWMSDVVTAVLAATPAPTPSPSPTEPDPMSVTPGFAGFVAIFLVALAVTFLMVDMSRRVRRLRYRSEVAAREAGDDSGASAGPTSHRA